MAGGGLTPIMLTEDNVTQELTTAGIIAPTTVIQVDSWYGVTHSLKSLASHINRATSEPCILILPSPYTPDPQLKPFQHKSLAGDSEIVIIAWYGTLQPATGPGTQYIFMLGWELDSPWDFFNSILTKFSINGVIIPSIFRSEITVVKEPQSCLEDITTLIPKVYVGDMDNLVALSISDQRSTIELILMGLYALFPHIREKMAEEFTLEPLVLVNRITGKPQYQYIPKPGEDKMRVFMAWAAVVTLAPAYTQTKTRVSQITRRVEAACASMNLPPLKEMEIKDTLQDVNYSLNSIPGLLSRVLGWVICIDRNFNFNNYILQRDLITETEYRQRYNIFLWAWLLLLQMRMVYEDKHSSTLRMVYPVTHYLTGGYVRLPDEWLEEYKTVTDVLEKVFDSPYTGLVAELPTAQQIKTWARIGCIGLDYHKAHLTSSEDKASFELYAQNAASNHVRDPSDVAVAKAIAQALPPPTRRYFLSVAEYGTVSQVRAIFKGLTKQQQDEYYQVIDESSRKGAWFKAETMNRLLNKADGVLPQFLTELRMKIKEWGSELMEQAEAVDDPATFKKLRGIIRGRIQAANQALDNYAEEWEGDDQSSYTMAGEVVNTITKNLHINLKNQFSFQQLQLAEDLGELPQLDLDRIYKALQSKYSERKRHEFLADGHENVEESIEDTTKNQDFGSYILSSNDKKEHSQIDLANQIDVSGMDIKTLGLALQEKKSEWCYLPRKRIIATDKLIAAYKRSPKSTLEELVLAHGHPI